MVAAKKARKLVEPPVFTKLTEDDKTERLLKAQKIRFDAWKHIEELADEAMDLHEESDALWDIVDKKTVADGEIYAKRLREVCAREREILPALRAGLVAFQVANLNAIMSGANSAWAFDRNRLNEALEKKDPKEASWLEGYTSDPLWDGKFDYESHISSEAEGTLETLAKDYPELV